MDFTGKVALITGASSGIGAATAKLFASNGASVTIIGRNEQRLLAVANACQAARGIKPLCLLLDLTLDNSCEEAVRKTIETFGRIDILINSAGTAAVTSLFDTTMEIFDELVAINLRVPYRLTQLCLPHLVKSKGNVVNIFGAPMRPRPGFLPFSMITDAMERFTKSGALEVSSEAVRINAVRPGITRTNFLTNLNIDDDCVDAAYQVISHTVPNKTIIEADEIAKMVLFVASNTCPNLNAANITVDSAASVY